MDSEELQRIDEADSEYELIRKDYNDIIEEIDFDTEEEKLICTSIISNMEKFIANSLKNDKCVNIPYIGCVRKNAVMQTVKKNKLNFKLAKTELTKEQYKEHVRSYIADTKEKQAKLDKDKLTYKKLKSKFNKKYKELYLKLGKAYAELFIISMSWFKEVPFDQDIQDVYDNANKN